ncbi:MAG: hypothetical protein GC164_08005 [Phycisphaera sp.]|nr:hypothetical protein [Phycisphaera sp.]
MTRPVRIPITGATGGLSASAKAMLFTVMLICVLSTPGCGKKEPPSIPPGEQQNEADKTKGETEADAAGRYRDDAGATDPRRATKIIKAAVLAPKPTGPLPPDASCVTPACHVNALEMAYVHGPINAGQCGVCHDEDKGGHTYPLKRPGNETCTFCHAVVGHESVVHKAVTTDGCTSCHDPHASPTKYLLKRPNTEEMCRQCHELPRHKFEHAPFAMGQCTLCHSPHEADNKLLLRVGPAPGTPGSPDGNDHCFSCHGDIQRLMANAPHRHEPAEKNCLTCHDAHSTDHDFQLTTAPPEECFACHENMKTKVESAAVSHDALFEKQSCANCHNPHAAGRTALLGDREDKLCMTCHNEPVKAHDGREIASMTDTLSRKFLHGPVRSGDCTACHNVHGSSYTRLLTKAFPESFYAKFDLRNYVLCFSCHDKELVLDEKTASLTNFRDGDENLHYVHVHKAEKGRTCKTCHSIHGSDLPNHMASDVPFEGSNWPMPIKFEKTTDGGSCSPGCHEPKTYSRDKKTGNPPAPATAPNVPPPTNPEVRHHD